MLKKNITDILKYSLLVLLFVIAASCDDNSSDPQPESKVLVDATLTSTTSAAQIKLVLGLSGLAIDVNEFKYDVDVYRVTYKTHYKDAEAIASGLIVLPKTADKVGMLSYQHGTITTQQEAPSNTSGTSFNATLYSAFSASGFITVIPDYLGFGTSGSIVHPYFVADVTASTVADMLVAAQELAEKENVNFNSKLFLAGYSEGGYATMATHKFLEDKPIAGLALTASFAGAGAYDVKGIQENLFAQKTYNDPYYLAFIVRAYQVTYDFTNIASDFFNDLYAGRIAGLFDGQKSASTINGQLTTSIPELIKEDIRANIDNDEKYDYIVEALESNSLIDWVPVNKIFLYHGKSDTTVPYQNSVDTYEGLLDAGASSSTVTLTQLEGDHGTAVTPFILDMAPKLWALR